ncbi:hypothetical protein YC2023_109316 [Brassica napus]
MNKMLHKGIDPTPVTYRTVIHRYCQMGKVDDLVLEKMLLRQKCRTVNQVIEKLCGLGKLEEADKILGKVLRTASTSDAKTCYVLMEGYLKKGVPLSAYKVACRTFNRDLIPDVKMCEKLSKRLVLIRHHFRDNACLLADSDSKPKVETVAGKGKVAADKVRINLFDYCYSVQSSMVSWLTITDPMQSDKGLTPLGCDGFCCLILLACVNRFDHVALWFVFEREATRSETDTSGANTAVPQTVQPAHETEEIEPLIASRGSDIAELPMTMTPTESVESAPHLSKSHQLQKQGQQTRLNWRMSWWRPQGQRQLRMLKKPQ